MSAPLFWKSLSAQTAAIALLFGVLVALPLPEDFFESFGFVVGPAAWIACALLTARVLALSPAFALFAAVAGGVAGTVVLLAASHWAGMVVALLVFAASCAGYEPGAEQPATTE